MRVCVCVCVCVCVLLLLLLGFAARICSKLLVAFLSKDEFISDVFLWTPTHGRTTVWRPTKIYVYGHSMPTEGPAGSNG